ncbi:MAG TPA: GNAT family N-acetyltransferase [Candidatus Dormibacteraeota bacterium]|nr:GNAT family N-acetyltransferase [Candidatus Dormibacteraeota bacterium]
MENEMMVGRSHPHHDAIAQQVRSWYTRPSPEISLGIEQRWCGFVTDPDSYVRPRLVLTIDQAQEVPAALSEVASLYDGREVDVWVDDRGRADRVQDALVASGCQPTRSITFLALVGPMVADPGPAHLVVEEVTGARLRTWAEVKLQGFADSEEPADPTALASEITQRRAEASAVCYELASLGGEPVAALAWYRGRDQLAFNLATRVPYRHRGIGQALLGRWAANGVAEGCRSLLINADEGGPAAALYRRMGFTDEVYWRRGFRFVPSKSTGCGSGTSQRAGGMGWLGMSAGIGGGCGRRS